MDRTVFHLINEQWTSPALDLFMAALSNSEIWKPLFIGDRAERGLLWGIQGPSVRHMPVLVFADCGTVHRYVEVSRGSASPQASRECADGRNAKDAPEVHDFVQKTYYPFFRSIRSEPIRAIISIGPHDE